MSKITFEIPEDAQSRVASILTILSQPGPVEIRVDLQVSGSKFWDGVTFKAVVSGGVTEDERRLDINDLGFTVRTIKTLYRHDIETLGQLLDQLGPNGSELIKLLQVGPRKVEEVLSVLRTRGFLS